MEIFLIILSLIGGTAILSWGANMFVESSSHIARRFGVPAIVIGLTVVAFGTSAPELAVNVVAALKGNSGIALGNVVGSNIFNVAVILGVCSIIMPLYVNMQLLKLDIPIMVVVSLLLFLAGMDGKIVRIEGFAFFSGMILYTIVQIRMAAKERKRVKEEYNQEFAETGNKVKDGLLLIFGLVLLVVGAELFVNGAVGGARLLGWSEALIGLTIIAAGTSLPEVATSIAATLKGERDIAIGNVVGSNIFNILGVIGISSLITDLEVGPHMAKIDILVMLGIAFLVLPFAIRKQTLGRFGGFIFVSIWLSYTIYLIKQS